MSTSMWLLIENGCFVAIATLFLGVTGWTWRNSKPYSLPDPLPSWFQYWFGSVQFLGTVPLIIALVVAIREQQTDVIWIISAYFVLLAAQVLSEFLTLRQFQSVVWVMVPYLYVPYRLWQLYEGTTLTQLPNSLGWIDVVLLAEIFVWGGNYLLDLAQLPRLLRWPRD